MEKYFIKAQVNVKMLEYKLETLKTKHLLASILYILQL